MRRFRSFRALSLLAVPCLLLLARADSRAASPPAASEEPTAAASLPEEDSSRSSFGAPAAVTAVDTPDDGGGSITVRWSPVPGAVRYRIERAEPGQEFTVSATAVAHPGGGQAGRPGAPGQAHEDQSSRDGTPYIYRVVAIGPQGEEGVSPPTPVVASRPQWFNRRLALVLLSVAGFILLTFHFIRRARAGGRLFIRRIAGLEAVDEAVGRATEMGRPVLFLTGTADLSQVSTIASLNVLGEIARKTARLGARLRVPNCKAVVYTVAREVVQGAYAAEGRPDAHDPESVFFLVENLQAYSSAVCGIMVRERPAANFLLGNYGSESLLLAETGAATGAIQIAGTDAATQLPFFVVACDYTLLGEELYAASAYLSREPLAVGALKGQDWGKVVLLAFLLIGTLLALVAGLDVGAVLETSAH